ncbi:MAG: hypothetical protein NXH90_13635 [Flavobacteriaceae bacterium]|nr:hypothetical protein [Flavobacteriaceae bacterium]
MEKIEPYQGWIGLIFCIWGVWGIISAILNLGWLTAAPIWWMTFLAGGIVEAGLGFMLSYGLTNSLLSKNEVARERAERVREKIAPKQGKLGMLGMAVGIWMIIASFIFI